MVFSLIAFSAPLSQCLALNSPDLKGWLVAPPSLEREVVLLPNESSPEKFRILALALHAEIKQEGKRWVVLRDAKRVAELRKKDQEFLKSQIEAIALHAEAAFLPFLESAVEAPFQAMKIAKARYDARSTDDRVDESGLEASTQSPAAHLLVDLVRDAPKELVDAPPGQLTVFSNRPVDFERFVRVDPESFGKYLTAQKRFVSWSESALANGRVPEAYAWAFPKNPFRPGERTLQLTVDRRGEKLGLSLQIYDPIGACEATASLFEQDPSRRGGQEQRRLLGKVLVPKGFLEGISRARLGRENFPFSSLDPVAHEPLGRFVHPPLSLIAKAKGYSGLIGCVPDVLMDRIEPCVVGDYLDLDQLEGEIRRAGCEFLDAEGALILRPINPLQEEALRIDRRPLSALYKKASSGNLSLNDVLAYHAAYSDQRGVRSMIDWYERPIRTNFIKNQKFWNLPHPILAVLGIMRPSDRQMAWTGGSVLLKAESAPGVLLDLARYVSSHGLSAPPPQTAVYPQGVVLVSGSDLERSGTRLLAQTNGVLVQGMQGHVYPLLRRIARESGEILDKSPVSLSELTRHLDRETAWEDLDRSYRFLWVEERLTMIKVMIGNNGRVGPIQIRERGKESKDAVALGQVPGIDPAKGSGG